MRKGLRLTSRSIHQKVKVIAIKSLSDSDIIYCTEIFIQFFFMDCYLCHQFEINIEQKF